MGALTPRGDYKTYSSVEWKVSFLSFGEMKLVIRSCNGRSIVQVWPAP